jgi:hypothetical protein
MADTDKSIWESLDKGLTVTLKLIALGVVLLVVLVLSFCSDEKIKETSTWTFARLELAGLHPTKFSLLGVEFEAAATGTEVGNAAGLAADLQAISKDERVPQEVRVQLENLATQVDKYAQRLSERDKKVVAAIKNASRSPDADAKPVIGWVFLGRWSSSNAWAPPSDKISLSEVKSLDDLKKLKELKIERDVVLVERDPALPSLSEGAAEVGSVSFRLIRAGTGKLKILGIQPSPSIGDAEFQWARVEVNPSDLYEVKH